VQGAAAVALAHCYSCPAFAAPLFTAPKLLERAMANWVAVVDIISDSSARVVHAGTVAINSMLLAYQAALQTRDVEQSEAVQGVLAHFAWAGVIRLRSTMAHVLDRTSRMSAALQVPHLPVICARPTCRSSLGRTIRKPVPTMKQFESINQLVRQRATEEDARQPETKLGAIAHTRHKARRQNVEQSRSKTQNAHTGHKTCLNHNHHHHDQQCSVTERDGRKSPPAGNKTRCTINNMSYILNRLPPNQDLNFEPVGWCGSCRMNVGPNRRACNAWQALNTCIVT
jgi:hypothetical protein